MTQAKEGSVSGRLTKAQRAILSKIAQDGPATWPWGSKPLTRDTLQRAGLIEPLNRMSGDPVFEITEAGRQALKDSDHD